MMFKVKHYLSLLSILSILVIVSPVQARMISSHEMLQDHQSQDRSELIAALEQDDVQKQLVEMGVDAKAALQRVDQMTEAEVAKLNKQIDNLPAGAGLSTVDLLLIIIIIILLA